MIGNLDIGDNKITNVGGPQNITKMLSTWGYLTLN